MLFKKIFISNFDPYFKPISVNQYPYPTSPKRAAAGLYCPTPRAKQRNFGKFCVAKRRPRLASGRLRIISLRTRSRYRWYINKSFSQAARSYFIKFVYQILFLQINSDNILVFFGDNVEPPFFMPDWVSDENFQLGDPGYSFL